MADLKASVRSDINRLEKNIAQKTSDLVSLRDELKRHQRVYQLLGGGDRGARGPRRRRGRAKRIAAVNWGSVLQGLPGRFTIGDIAKEAVAGGKSSSYVRQVAVRWAKQGKTRRVGRGRYQKVGPRKSRAMAGPQTKK